MPPEPDHWRTVATSMTCSPPNECLARDWGILVLRSAARCARPRSCSISRLCLETSTYPTWPNGGDPSRDRTHEPWCERGQDGCSDQCPDKRYSVYLWSGR